MLSLPEICRSFLNKNIPDFTKKKYVLAVSGGVDSMVLLHIFHQFELSFGVVSLNHNLRKEAENELKFVEQECKKLNIPFFISKIPNDYWSSKSNVQEKARKFRYEFFEKIRKQHRYDYIVTAHHANDDVETFLLHLLRGSGIDGLSAIPEISGKVIRPLLSAKKSDILSYAKQHAIQWMEDSSNEELYYDRNRIRLEVIPILERIDKSAVNSIKSSIDKLKYYKDFLDDYVRNWTKIHAITQHRKEDIALKKCDFGSLNPVLKFHVIKELTGENLKEIDKLELAHTGSKFLIGDTTIWVDREEFIFQKSQPQKVSFYIESPNFSLPELHISGNTNLRFDANKKFLVFDLQKVSFPVHFRSIANGDFMQFPFGKKKVSKYLKDKKISNYAKQFFWVAEDAKGTILFLSDGAVAHPYFGESSGNQWFIIFD